ncbi:MAG: PHP domain-containing protein [Bacteroidota bacterium]
MQFEKNCAVNSAGADLHMHTNYSDGVFEPSALLKKVKKAGMEIVSITDHDTVDALDEAIDIGDELNIEVIPGVELSVSTGDNDIHLLAYFFDYKNSDLLAYLHFAKAERYSRAVRIVEKLHSIGIPLDFDAVLSFAGKGCICRTHIAKALHKNKFVHSLQESFVKYIGYGQPAYEEKKTLSIKEAIALINSAGGLTFIAHPGKNFSDAVFHQLVDDGIDGIEVIHPSHTTQLVKHYRSLATEYFLLESGGSDFHGAERNDGMYIGTYTIPTSFVDTMRHRLFQQTYVTI